MAAIATGALGFSIAQFMNVRQMDEITTTVRLDMATQLTTLATLTEAMSRGGADTVTEQVIKDCSADERIRFDDLLSGLAGGLARTELVEVSRLFDRCGSFYSRQKAVMAARLEREVEVYERIANHQSLLTGDDEAVFALESWRLIVSLEKEQSELYAKLVDLQGRIISALLDDEAANSAKITALLTEVKEILEMQSYNALKLRQIRETLPTAL